MSCPRCGCDFVIEWWDSKCPQCELDYKVDTQGELWSDDEFPFITEWAAFDAIDPFDCGVQAYYAGKDKGFEMECPWEEGTRDNLEWHRGFSQAKEDCE